MPAKTVLAFIYTRSSCRTNWVNMSLLNEDIMMFKFSVLVQAEIFSFSKDIRSAECVHKVTDLQKKPDYASIKIPQSQQEPILLKQTKPSDKKQIVVCNHNY